MAQFLATIIVLISIVLFFVCLKLRTTPTICHSSVADQCNCDFKLPDFGECGQEKARFLIVFENNSFSGWEMKIFLLSGFAGEWMMP